MNTPAHILICAAAFSKRRDRQETRVAALGGLIPDLSLYILVFVSLFILRIQPDVVFDKLYFSDLWQGIFAVDNSIPLWASLAVFGHVTNRRLLMVLSLSCLIHIGLDMPVHHDDGRVHFWPFSDYVFESPISYWDGAHHAAIIAPIEGLLALIAAVVLFVRYPRIAQAMPIALLLAVEIMLVSNWLWIF